MTGSRAVGITVLLLGVTSLAAAQDRWSAPKCDLKPGHFMVNSGLLYLRSATNTNFAAQRDKDLRDAQKTLMQAITQNGQDKNGAAWYYLARYYGLSDQLLGADSAFTRAQALVPSCKDDITTWRKLFWTPVFNQGVQAYNAGKTDSALHYFRIAAAIRPEPVGVAALAALFANGNQIDSALKYYDRAAEVAGADTQYVKERREALYNRAALLYQIQRWDEAVTAFRTYLTAYPNDVQAMAALASTFTQSNRADSALAIYRKVLERADSAEPASLFAAGNAMFNSAASRGAQDTVAKSTYRMAARAFEAGLARAPMSRDGLFNAVNTYYLLGDTAKIVPAVRRLIAIDPMNRSALRLAAAAFQMRGRQDSTVFYVAQAESILAVDVSVQSFRTKEQGAALVATVTNFHKKPSPVVKLVFEFLDAKGAVVTTLPGEIPTLAPDATHNLQIEATGAGITSWRYKKAAG